MSAAGRLEDVCDGNYRKRSKRELELDLTHPRRRKYQSSCKTGRVLKVPRELCCPPQVVREAVLETE